MERLRRRRETKEKTKLNVPINGNNYSLSLEHPPSVLHRNVEIIVADGSKSEEIYQLPSRSCHLVGDIDGHTGRASLSYCDRLVRILYFISHEIANAMLKLSFTFCGVQVWCLHNKNKRCESVYVHMNPPLPVYHIHN